MTSSLRAHSYTAERWFGPEFEKLHPLLQELHRNGGRLTGSVEVKLHPLVSSWAKRKLGVQPGANALQVDIEHAENGFYWRRRFNQQNTLSSFFQPVGTQSHGYWLERTGALQLHLGVDVIDGGWHWRPLRYTLLGLSLPRYLLPRTVAYKRIVANRYHFYVSVRVPLLGTVLEYRGALQA